jgi:hypothetical protein
MDIKLTAICILFVAGLFGAGADVAGEKTFEASIRIKEGKHWFGDCFTQFVLGGE